MNYLIDTHALLWFIDGDERLSERARALIKNKTNRIAVSAACLWEVAIKSSIGKLKLGQPFGELFPKQLEDNDIELLAVSVEHLKIVRELPFHHRDPFDRLLIAQSLAEAVPVISIDTAFDDYGVERLW